MTTLILSHECYLAHDTGAYHPESPGRLRSVLKALEQASLSGFLREEAPRATSEEIARAIAELVSELAARDIETDQDVEILEPDAADTAAVETGLERDHVTGDEWDVPIEDATARVVLPENTTGIPSGISSIVSTNRTPRCSKLRTTHSLWTIAWRT